MRPVRAPRPLEAERAWDYALDLLARRAATAAEVAERLERRGVERARVDEIVARLVELRLLDDRAFAAAYLRRRRDQRGRHALRAELLRKGVGEEVVEGALRGEDDEVALDEDQQRAAAAALLAKHAWRFAPRPVAPAAGATPPDAARADADARRRARARAAAFLARRGFAPDAVASAVAELPGDPDDDAVPDLS